MRVSVWCVVKNEYSPSGKMSSEFAYWDTLKNTQLIFYSGLLVAFDKRDIDIEVIHTRYTEIIFKILKFVDTYYISSSKMTFL